MGETHDLLAVTSARNARRNPLPESDVLWADFILDAEGGRRIAFEAVLLEKNLPPRAFRCLAVGIANYAEARKPLVDPRSVRLPQAPDGIVQIRGCTEPIEAMSADPDTLTLWIGETIIVHSQLWHELRLKAKKAESRP